LSRLAEWLATPASLIETARTTLVPLYQKLLPAIQDPLWRENLSEEYFVFHLPPKEPLSASGLLEEHCDWLARLLRLEGGSLSNEEVAEALRLHLRYSPDDLFIPDWAAAVLLDSDCEETLQTIEFTNLQLLEFRNIDNRLDDSLKAAYGLIHKLTRSLLPFWRSHGRDMRAVGEAESRGQRPVRADRQRSKAGGRPIPGPRLPPAGYALSLGRLGTQHPEKAGSDRGDL